MGTLKNSLVARSMSKVAIVVAVGAGALTATNASAAVLYGVGAANERANYAGQLGTQFTVGATDMTVHQLGLYDGGTAGFVDSHPVRIYDSSGTNVLASVTIDSTTPGNAGNYSFLALTTPVTLSANTTYVLTAWYPSLDPENPASPTYRTTNDPFRDLFAGSTGPTPGFSSDASSYSGRFSNNISDVFSDQSFGGGYGGPNLSTTAIPEPTSLALLGLGALGLLRRRAV